MSLTKQRGAIQGKVTRFANFLESIQAKYADSPVPEEEIACVQTRLDEIEPCLNAFEQLSLQIEAASDAANEETDGIETSIETFETKYYSAIAKAKTLIKRNVTVDLPSSTLSQTPASRSLTASSNNTLKLPTINIPHFKGTFEDWLNFKDLFVGLIHENSELDDVQTGPDLS